MDKKYKVPFPIMHVALCLIGAVVLTAMWWVSNQPNEVEPMPFGLLLYGGGIFVVCAGLYVRWWVKAQEEG
jgi:hypothetical protein